MDMKTFKKRDGGGAIQGHMYEFKLILLITLRAILEVFKFKVASNMEEAGDFDDFVGSLKYTDDQGITKSKTIFLQAKHVMDANDKKISKYELCQKKKGKFYLEKYFKSFLKIKNNETVFSKCNFNIINLYLIIYTNACIDSDDQQYFESIETDEFLKLLLTSNENVYKLKPEYYNTFKESITGDEQYIYEFFDSLLFCTSQSNEPELENTIKFHISKRYGEYNTECINECFNKSSKLIQNWWSEIGKSTFLTENNDFVQDSSSNLSINRVKIVRDQILLEIKSKNIEFNRNFSLELSSICSLNNIVKIQCLKDTLLIGLARVNQSLKTGPNNECILVNEYLLKSLLGQEAIHNFKNCVNKNTLVIAIQKLENLIELLIFLEIKSILQTNINKKLVVIYESDNIEITGENIKVIEMCNDFRLQDLSEKCRSYLLNLEITFHDHNISILDLYENNAEYAINCEIISILLLNNNIRVASKVDYLQNVWNCYIPRKFVHNAYIDIRSLKACKKDIFLILTDLQQIKSCIYFENNCPLYPSSINKNSNIFVHCIEENIEEIFTEFCSKYADKNAHLLQLKDDVLCWEKTYGSIKTIQAITSNINTKTQYTESQLVERCEEHRLAIISDVAGMGKSIVLKGIAQIIAEKHPDVWIEVIDLNSITLKIKIEELRDFASLKSFLLSILTFNDITEQIFFISMLEVGKVVLLFDGFDEVKTNMEDTFIYIINTLMNFAVRQIYISCRTSKQEQLEQIFNVLSYQFIELSEKDQIFFLAKIWSQTHLRIDKDDQSLQELASRFLKKFNSLRIKDDISICGIPLQLRIISEIYQSPNEEILSIIDDDSFQMSLTDIYDIFFQKKIEITNERGLFCSQFSLSVKDVRKLHQLLAISLLFSESERKCLLLKSEIAQLETHHTNPFIQMYGIITKLTKENVNFAHRTFAEFLAAEFILQRSFDSTNEKFQEIFVENILINCDYRVVRIFINDILANFSALSFILKNLAYKMWKKNYWFQHNLGCTPLHIAASENNCKILNLFIESNRYDPKYLSALINSKDVTHKTALHVAAAKGHLNIVKILYETKSSVNNTDNNGLTVLVSSAFSGNWELFNWLCVHNIDIDQSKKHLNMLLSMARFSGNLKAVNWLVEKGADAKSTVTSDDTALHEAVRSGNIELISWYLKNGADINIKNEKCNTVLFEAMHLKMWDVARYLIDNDADIYAVNSDGNVNFYAIVVSGNVEIAAYVLSKGVNINIIDESGNYILNVSIAHKLWGMADLLIENGANCNYMSTNGDYILHAAVKHGNLQCVKKCLEGKANINAENVDGFTALHLSLILKEWDIAYFLIYNGCEILEEFAEENNYSSEVQFLKWMTKACEKIKLCNSNNKNNESGPIFTEWLNSHHLSIDCKDQEGGTFLQQIARNHDLNLCKNGDFKGCYCIIHHFKCVYHHNCTCIYIPNIKVLSWLNSNGVDFNAKNKNGKTALHIATENGNLIMVSWLLKVQGNVNERNNDGEIPLHVASKNGNIDIFKRLLENGSIIDTKDIIGNTPLYYAAKNGHIEIVKILLQKDANINLVNNKKETVLHFAVNSEDTDLISLILKEGANINAYNSNGDTVLHYAVKYAKLDIVSWLIEKGANINAINNIGDTVLYLAYKYQKLDIFKWLLSKGCSVNAKDTNGITDFHKIVRSCDTQILKLLIRKGGNLSCKTNNGSTLLHYAAEFSNIDCISHLIKICGARINVTDNNNLSVLHSAINSGSLLTVKWLIDNNADAKAVDITGSNILHIAASSFLVQDSCKNDHKNNVLKYLINLKRVNINAKNLLNQTPLDIAIKENHINIITILKNAISRDRGAQTSIVYCKSSR